MKKSLLYALALAALLLVAAQIVPYGRANNPVVQEEVTAPPDVLDVLRRSCYDCHSHETRWPWYASVAPAKWLVRHDVAEGREHLNFSAWSRYDAEERAEKWEEVAEEVAEGHMPPWYYLPLHGDARLSEEERTTLRRWGDQQAGATVRQRGSGESEAED